MLKNLPPQMDTHGVSTCKYGYLDILNGLAGSRKTQPPGRFSGHISFHDMDPDAALQLAEFKVAKPKPISESSKFADFLLHFQVRLVYPNVIKLV